MTSPTVSREQRLEQVLRMARTNLGVSMGKGGKAWDGDFLIREIDAALSAAPPPPADAVEIAQGLISDADLEFVCAPEEKHALIQEVEGAIAAALVAYGQARVAEELERCAKFAYDRAQKWQAEYDSHPSRSLKSRMYEAQTIAAAFRGTP